MSTCELCDWWTRSDLISRKEKGDKNGITKKQCVALLSEVSSSDKKCKYFRPVHFYCDQNNQRLMFEQCIVRRRNIKNFTAYQVCKKCRQFDKEIRPIIEEYFLDMTPTVIPRHLSRPGDVNVESLGSGKIKRRNKAKQEPNGKRKIKRRKKPQTEEKPRKIKRRAKKINNLDPGPNYTICPKCNQKGMKDNYCRICAYRADLEMTPKMKQIANGEIEIKPKRKLKRRNK